jgi:hypothetical protein
LIGSILVFCIFILGIELRAIANARQVLYHCNCDPSLFVYVLCF